MHQSPGSGRKCQLIPALAASGIEVQDHNGSIPYPEHQVIDVHLLFFFQDLEEAATDQVPSPSQGTALTLLRIQVTLFG